MSHGVGQAVTRVLGQPLIADYLLLGERQVRKLKASGTLAVDPRPSTQGRPLDTALSNSLDWLLDQRVTDPGSRAVEAARRPRKRDLTPRK